MLTNIYYYNFYRPYILKSQGVARSQAAGPALPGGKSGESVILLNKAYKSDIVKYAKELSENVVGLKESANDFVKNVRGLRNVISSEGAESAAAWLNEDARVFIGRYNDFSGFAAGQQHSDELSKLAADAGELLKDIPPGFFTLDENGVLHINGEYLFSAAKETGMKELDEFKTAVEEIYRDAIGFLQKPLAEHMNFKNLGYYYNYKMGSYSDNTFQLIEGGMLVDRRI